MTCHAPVRRGCGRVLAQLSAIPLLALLAIPAPALLVSLALALPAAAHSQLLNSDPAAGVTLDTPPSEVVLTFSEEIEPSFTHMTLTAGGGQPRAMTPKVQGTQVAADVDPATSKATGRWSVGYRVVSADGHPITGVVTFAVTPSAQSTPEPSRSAAGSSSAQPTATARPTTSATPSATAQAAESQAGRAGPGSSPVAWLVAGSAVLIGGLAAAAWRVRKKPS